MDRDGNNQRQPANWKYSTPNDDVPLDYYGRMDWSVAFTVFGSTKN
ncbi:MAG: hypothetical protein QHH06_09005 [Clostridiales bacterium]|nr:hypothetical protein [Eubacteriales bacterium]MDH7566604.1 hypothetical protein [Clostridiales bacterium]